MSPSSLRARRSKLIRHSVALVVLALVASACASGVDEPAASPAIGDETELATTSTTSPELDETDTDEVADGGSQSLDPDALQPAEDAPLATESRVDLSDIPVGTIDWSPCAAGAATECGFLEVPIDYRDLDAGTLQISVNRVPAANPDERIGVLLVNPGGPGGDGTAFADRFANGGFPAEITDRFDVIGFDPRGVGDSEPAFACGQSGEQIAVLSAIEDIIDEPDEVDAAEQAVQLCVDSLGSAAGLLDTGSVVRDMEQIRRALGEEQISYLGFSYGSTVGVWYATLFASRVRAMVIDGADNPIDDISDFDARLASAREETEPLERLLAEALDACETDACPIFNDGDPVGYYLDTVPDFDLVIEDNANNPNAPILGLITPLYNESLWPVLWDALADLRERQDPTAFTELAEFQLGTDPGSVNFTPYVNCLDSWALQPENDREARLEASAEFFAIEEQIAEEFPLLFAIEDGLASACSFMDVLDTPVLDVPFDGGGVPILVVGNTSDPVTSFGESEELVEETLANGVLLEVDHGSHTVYPANPCVNDVVHSVLVDTEHLVETVVCERVDTDVESILRDVCIELAPQISPGLAEASLRDVCDNFVAAASGALDDEAILGGLEGSDDDATATLLTILQEEALSTGG